MFKGYTKKGFTLIELLVVISIIGLLSSVVLASVNAARSKARDSKRIQDMHQIQLALELYKSNTGGYPASGGTRENSCWAVTNVSHPATFTSVPGGGWTSALTSLVTTNLMPSLPVDPQNIGNITTTSVTYPFSCYSYVSGPSGTFQTCIDIATGQYVYPDDDNYEYALYLSLENTPTKGRVIHWHNGGAASTHYEPENTPANSPSVVNVNTRPYNYCILGPKK